jgi:hypothetical protein
MLFNKLFQLSVRVKVVAICITFLLRILKLPSSYPVLETSYPRFLTVYRYTSNISKMWHADMS